jgi:hypothetical protein
LRPTSSPMQRTGDDRTYARLRCSISRWALNIISGRASGTSVTKTSQCQPLYSHTIIRSLHTQEMRCSLQTEVTRRTSFNISAPQIATIPFMRQRLVVCIHHIVHFQHHLDPVFGSIA